MLARVKEFDGDVDKLLAEYQQVLGIESGQPNVYNRDLKDCVAEPRVATSAVTRIAYNVASSSSVSSGVASSMDSSMDSSVSSCRV